VSADKAYSGNPCHDAIAKVGATPYIMFRENTTGKVGGLFKKMFHFFQFKRDEFLAHYHRRSNVETTVSMVKSKFGDAVRSKTEVAAKNEVLAKVLCHNICCLISAMYELKIVPILAEQTLTPAIWRARILGGPLTRKERYSYADDSRISLGTRQGKTPQQFKLWPRK